MFMNARSQDLLYIKLLLSIFILSFPVTYQYINHKLGNCFDQYILLGKRSYAKIILCVFLSCRCYAYSHKNITNIGIINWPLLGNIN